MKTPSMPTWAVIPEGQPLSARSLLIQLYWAGVRAASPGPALHAALDKIPPRELAQRRVWILAVGKAANPMATVAVEFLAEHHLKPAGGILITPRAVPPPHPSMESVMGDHPVPGAHSAAAARTLGSVAARVKGDDEVWVLLSGGATSLIAAPEGAIRPEEMMELFTLLLGSGLDIATMNLIRKRFTRWGAGRLAAALKPARVRNYIVSDVIGDDMAAIGSGPCVPDPSTASQIRALLVSAHLWDRTPQAIRRYLHAVERDATAETPKAGDEAFANVERKIIASNRIALEAAATLAKAFGYEPRILGASIAGDASAVGKRLAATLLSYCSTSNAALTGRAGTTCLIWGGETTVTLPAGATGMGGRCQELALAAARELAEAKSARGSTLLACGTDGRDGPTDAAGAIVDRDTWTAIERAGRDPAHDLAAHDAYHALDAAEALLRTDLTATNVMDIMIGVCAPPDTSMWPPRTPGGSLARISGSFKRIVGRE